MTTPVNRAPPPSPPPTRRATAGEAAHGLGPHAAGIHGLGGLAGVDPAALLAGLAGNLMGVVPGSAREESAGDEQGHEHGGHETEAPVAEPEPVDARVRYVGETVGSVCSYAQAQTVWSARIPLDEELLPHTVLHLAYSCTQLDLRFETSEWEVRELLRPQLGALERLVGDMLPPSCAVSVSL